ncbi:MAG TPA: glutamine--fructose-6-phosphate transaminase (isomerizing) [Acidimicrobiales bacterium]|nr:glutamine--fructose-6-phosphate transaminase (isomerizing) [Acidimicrobiales bacterium]
MCGIIGLTGSSDTLRLLREGLEKLEYRGYDSAGIAVVDGDGGGIVRHRSAERGRAIVALGDPSLVWPESCGAGIGHTRWATHGAPTHDNAHPHADCTKAISIVHNGIIENHREISAALVAEGHAMSSATDSEVVAHLIERERAKGLSPVDSVRAAVRELRGDFALCVIFAIEPDLLIAARRTSPLIIGKSASVGYVASDIAALLPMTRDLYVLEDDELAEIRPGTVRVTDLVGVPVGLAPFHVTWDVAAAQKGGYDDFMTKEMYEQPAAVANTLLGRFADRGETDFEELCLGADQLAAFGRVLYLACGSSYHAALSASLATEHFARVLASAEVASEFRYRDAVLGGETLVVAVSQSGESVDTLHALREAKRRGATTIAVTNVVGSVMSREADAVLYTHAGPEIGVASTKCHLAHIALLDAFALHLGHVRGVLDASAMATAASALVGTPRLITRCLDRADEYFEIAEKYANVNDFYFLGRRTGYPIALEGALKLKELAYVRAEAYPAGEMKHGPIALIEPGAIVVVVATRTTLWEKVMANVEEMRARGATVIAVAEEDDSETESLVDAVLRVPKTMEFCSPIVEVVPLQCFAYAIARARGHDPDRPRNLAKVVTVE